MQFAAASRACLKRRLASSVQGVAGLHAVDRPLRGALDLAAAVGDGQQGCDLVKLPEHVVDHLPHVRAGQLIGGLASGLGVHVHVLGHDHRVAEVHDDPAVEAGAVEAGTGDDAVVPLGIHFAFEFLDLGDDLVAAVDARIGDVPHADGERIGAVHAVDEEPARGASVLAVIGQHVEFGLFVGGPFVPLHGPVAVVEQGVEVQFELLGGLEPRTAGCRILG